MTELLNYRYRILQTIGDGGFGQTFLAEDAHLPSNRRCIIKQLKPVTDRPQIYQLVKERFQREAAILEALSESNSQIPKLYAYFEADGLFYLVQEWIDGITLAQAVQQHGQSQEMEVRTLLLNLLGVLNYIHNQGIIHRDIKPDNVMLRRLSHQPVLIDFGAVKETVQTVLNSQGQPTRSIIIGTPGYMPQEQAIGKPVFASDLYSLGLTAIYLLTGKSPQELEVHPQTGDYIWQKFAPQLSVEFAVALDRSIQPHARDRYPTAKEMLLALQSQSSPNTTGSSGTMTQPVSTPLSTSYFSASNTIVTSPQPSQFPLSSERRIRPVILSSLIAGGLIGGSVVLSLVLVRPFQSPTPQFSPEAANSSPQQLDRARSSATNSPTNSNQSTQIEVPTPATPQPNISTVKGESVQANDFAWLATRPVTDADLVGKTAFELDVLRNAIFAKHGRQFNDEALQTYFNSQTWYQPIYLPEEFPVSSLSNLEKQNAQYILDYQDRNGLR